MLSGDAKPKLFTWVLNYSNGAGLQMDLNGLASYLTGHHLGSCSFENLKWLGRYSLIGGHADRQVVCIGGVTGYMTSDGYLVTRVTSNFTILYEMMNVSLYNYTVKRSSLNDFSCCSN